MDKKIKRTNPKRKRAGVSRSKKLIIEFPSELYTRTERAVADLAVNRSALIRTAVEFYLDNLNRQTLERELAEGYIANASLNRRIAEDFAYSDSENI